jgi:hypothetical protein
MVDFKHENNSANDSLGYSYRPSSGRKLRSDSEDLISLLLIVSAILVTNAKLHTTKACF